MKKTLSILTIIVISFLAACSNDNNSTQETNKDDIDYTQDTSENNTDILPKPEYSSSEDWVSDLLKSLNADSYQPYNSRINYERHFGGYAAEIYTKHFIALSDNPNEIVKLKEIKNIASKINSEDNPPLNEEHKKLISELKEKLEKL